MLCPDPQAAFPKEGHSTSGSAALDLGEAPITPLSVGVQRSGAFRAEALQEGHGGIEHALPSQRHLEGAQSRQVMVWLLNTTNQWASLSILPHSGCRLSSRPC